MGGPKNLCGEWADQRTCVVNGRTKGPVWWTKTQRHAYRLPALAMIFAAMVEVGQELSEQTFKERVKIETWITWILLRGTIIKLFHYKKKSSVSYVNFLIQNQRKLSLETIFAWTWHFGELSHNQISWCLPLSCTFICTLMPLFVRHAVRWEYHVIAYTLRVIRAMTRRFVVHQAKIDN